MYTALEGNALEGNGSASRRRQRGAWHVCRITVNMCIDNGILSFVCAGSCEDYTAVALTLSPYFIGDTSDTTYEVSWGQVNSKSSSVIRVKLCNQHRQHQLHLVHLEDGERSAKATPWPGVEGRVGVVAGADGSVNRGYTHVFSIKTPD